MEGGAPGVGEPHVQLQRGAVSRCAIDNAPRLLRAAGVEAQGVGQVGAQRQGYVLLPRPVEHRDARPQRHVGGDADDQAAQRRGGEGAAAPCERCKDRGDQRDDQQMQREPERERSEDARAVEVDRIRHVERQHACRAGRAGTQPSPPTTSQYVAGAFRRSCLSCGQPTTVGLVIFYFFLPPDLREPRRGTLAPFFRASLSAIAIACLRLFTFRPEPLLSVPRFRRRMTDSTFFEARSSVLRHLCLHGRTVQALCRKGIRRARGVQASLLQSSQLSHRHGCGGVLFLLRKEGSMAEQKSRSGISRPRER